MGHSKADKADSHDRIVAVAAARLRERGVDGIGVAELMKEAGLTHGGFYRHFASREELVAPGIARALHDGAQGAFAAEERGALPPRELLFALVDWYLGAAHRDGLATSCAVTTLAADVARSSAPVRQRYTEQVGAYIELFARLMGEEELPLQQRRATALSIWSTLVGALSMARAVDDTRVSDEILRNAAADIKQRLS